MPARVELQISNPQIPQIFLLEKPVEIERFKKTAIHGLDLRLGEKHFLLPIVESKPGVGFAYFDPSGNPEMEESAAWALSELIVQQKLDGVVGISSSKSEGFFKKAIAIASWKRQKEVEYIIVHRGPLEDFEDKKKYRQEPIEYEAITGKKYLALSVEEDVKLKEWTSRENFKLGIADDVISTGGSVNALRRAINSALNRDQDDQYDVVCLFEELIYRKKNIKVDKNGNVVWRPPINKRHFYHQINPVILF